MLRTKHEECESTCGERWLGSCVAGSYRTKIRAYHSGVEVENSLGSKCSLRLKVDLFEPILLSYTEVVLHAFVRVRIRCDLSKKSIFTALVNMSTSDGFPT